MTEHRGIFTAADYELDEAKRAHMATKAELAKAQRRIKRLEGIVNLSLRLLEIGDAVTTINNLSIEVRKIQKHKGGR